MSRWTPFYRGDERKGSCGERSIPLPVDLHGFEIPAFPRASGEADEKLDAETHEKVGRVHWIAKAHHALRKTGMEISDEGELGGFDRRR